MKKRMIRGSIKRKITIWYTGIVAIILACVFVFLMVFIDKAGLSTTEKEVQGEVTGFAGNIIFKDDSFYMDSDTEFYNEGVMFCVYDKKGHLLYGSIPVEFPKNTTLKSHNPRMVTANNRTWIIYDGVYTGGHDQVVWVRGIASVHAMEASIRTVKQIMILIFPLLIVLIGLIGFFMIQRALKPVDQIREEARKISRGKDLSVRLTLPKEKDEMYMLTEEFNHMFQRLEEAFETEKQFTADASHELRTPIAVLISQCEYMLEQDDLSMEQREELMIILRQAKKMSHLVSQLLMMAREEKMEEAILYEEIDLSLLAEIIAEEMEQEAVKKNITLKTEIQEGMYVWGDQTLLMRLLMNLVQNGIKYGKENGHLWIIIEDAGDNVKGTIRDDGIGISPEHIDKIWNRFYRTDKSRSDSEGTGLGLAMVKWILNIHHGKIDVTSKEGEGSSFVFWLRKSCAHPEADLL